MLTQRGQPDALVRTLELKVFVVGALLLLASPLLLPFLSRERTYLGASRTQTGADLSFLHREIFSEKQPLDVAIFGSSRIWTAVHGERLERALARRLGREVQVRVFATNWNNDGLRTLLLRDLLERRKVGLVLLAPSAEATSKPHPGLQHFLLPRDLGHLPASAAIQRWALCALSVPRRTLSSVWSGPAPRGMLNQTSWGSLAQRAVASGSFVDRAWPAPELPATELIQSATSARLSFSPVDPIQRAEFARAVALARASGCRVAVLNPPPDLSSADSSVAQVRLNRDDVGRLNLEVLSVSGAELYRGRSRSETRALYYDAAHVNLNGSRLYTSTLAPAVAELLR